MSSMRVQAGAAGGATGFEEADAFVFAQGGGVQLDESSCDTDDVECISGPRAGLARCCF